MIDYLWGPALAFSLSAIGVGVTFRYTRRVGLLDVPNYRSSHRVPTPRGGGLALVASVFVLGAYAFVRTQQFPASTFALLAAAVIVLTWVGWLDDRKTIRVALRLSVHLVCGIAIATLVNEISPLPGWLNLLWLAWWVFWSVASINIVNFIDGIDGMIACQGVVYGLFLFSLMPFGSFGSSYGLILSGACLGFLLWNWPPAKMFMGDVGSGPLGLFFGLGGALALQNTRSVLVFLPLFPIFLDALLTIVVRFRRGEDLTDPHRSHLYQRLANGGAGHALVTLAYGLFAAMGAIVAFSVRNATPLAIAGAIAAYCAAVMLAWKVGDFRFPTVSRSTAQTLIPQISAIRADASPYAAEKAEAERGNKASPNALEENHPQRG
jgi:UDP-N-acetylmuramyl pentapeptide phosphotransferase/UDP-N-acetylglucosamine-1-phosphate transferase